MPEWVQHLTKRNKVGSCFVFHSSPHLSSADEGGKAPLPQWQEQRVSSILSPCHRNDSCLSSFFMTSKPLSPCQRQDIYMKCCLGTVGTQPVRKGMVCGNCDASYHCIYIYLVCSVYRVRKQSIFTYFVLLDGLVLLYNFRMQGVFNSI